MSQKQTVETWNLIMQLFLWDSFCLNFKVNTFLKSIKEKNVHWLLFFNFLIQKGYDCYWHIMTWLLSCLPFDLTTKTWLTFWTHSLISQLIEILIKQSRLDYVKFLSLHFIYVSFFLLNKFEFKLHRYKSFKETDIRLEFRSWKEKRV